jgi:phosphatidylglycerol:prolipoprotein diacylglycerol transferase
MVNIYLDPILLQWGPITVWWHGLCLAVGVLVSYLIFIRVGTRKGFSRPALSELALWLAVLGLACARLLCVSEYWQVYAADPLRLLAVHHGGLTVNGGILSGLLAAFFYARWKKL